MGFVLDHVWIVAPDRDVALSRLSAATGLAVQDGWSPGGRVRSRGVRFANGPFLDVHGSESGEGALVLLRGRIAEAETLAAARGWAAKTLRRPLASAEARPPWSMLMFRRGQGALSQVAVIEYEADPRGYAVAEYAGPLLWLDSAPAAGPSLARVQVGGAGGTLAALDCPGLSAGGDEGSVRIELTGADAASLRIGPVEVAFDG